MSPAPHVQEPEFYVGYLAHAPPGIARALRTRLVLLFALLAGGSVLLVSAHALRPVARFEYGAPVELSGTLVARPYPHLVVARPGQAQAGSPVSSYALVAPWKHGADSLVAGLDGQAVRLRATLAYRDGMVVAEVEPGSVRAEPGAAPVLPPTPLALGQRTLVGEIVDSKCFFGVMNPGELKSHRGCAARCISGGVPPVLCVRDADGRASYFLLVSRSGAPVNREVLDFVAEPVEITGAVERSGDNLVLRADPTTYRRLE